MGVQADGHAVGNADLFELIRHHPRKLIVLGTAVQGEFLIAAEPLRIPELGNPIYLSV